MQIKICPVYHIIPPFHPYFLLACLLGLPALWAELGDLGNFGAAIDAEPPLRLRLRLRRLTGPGLLKAGLGGAAAWAGPPSDLSISFRMDGLKAIKASGSRIARTHILIIVLAVMSGALIFFLMERRKLATPQSQIEFAARGSNAYFLI